MKFSGALRSFAVMTLIVGCIAKDGSIRGQRTNSTAIPAISTSNNQAGSLIAQRELQSCASPPTDSFVHIIAKHSNMGLNVAGNSDQPGAWIIQWPVDGNFLNDDWKLVPVDGGYFEIVSRSSGMALNVLDGSKDNEARVIQWYVNGWSTNDQWCFRDQGGGFYAIINRLSGKALDVEKISTAAGAGLTQFDFWGTDNQLFRLDRLDQCASPPTDSFVHIIAKHSNMGLNVAGNSDQPGAWIIQWPVDGNFLNDDWKLVPVDGGYFEIVSRSSGMALNVLDGSKDNEARVIQWYVNGWSTNDQWCFRDQGGGFYAIINRLSGKALDVEKISTAAGAGLTQFDFWGTDNQLFRLDRLRDSGRSFTTLSYNVAGLPQGISSAPTPRTEAHRVMSTYVNQFDIVNVQEDYNYHAALYDSGNNHPYRTSTTGGVGFGSGLNSMSRFPYTGFTRIKWRQCSGIEECFGNKGFTLMRVTVAGKQIDLYNTHMGAKVDDAALSTRRNQNQQLLDFINGNSRGRSVIVFGDFNSRWTRSGDNLEIFRSAGFRDAWVELLRGGDYPGKGNAIDCPKPQFTGPNCEVVDKALYRDDGNIGLRPTSYELRQDAVLNDGRQLSDHPPMVVLWVINA